MDSERWAEVETLLNDALALRPSHRPAFIGGIADDEVRSEVESLLRAQDADEDVSIELAVAQAAAALTTSAPQISFTADEFGGRYRILRVIGQGGMGTVYLADQLAPVRRKVALKLILPGMDSEQIVARFEAERQALAMMDHPGIATVLDAGVTSSGRPYFVMEFVDGAPITEYCDTHALSIPERLRLFRSVCQAVQHAHQKGIIHRDLKPSNILITAYDGAPAAKVIDFGLARIVEQPLVQRSQFTTFGVVLGTVQYMSPEQAGLTGADLDTRSDVYSLGAVLYELLTGTTPLVADEVANAAYAEVLRRIVDEDPPPPSNRLLNSRNTLEQTSAERRTNSARLPRIVAGDLDWIVMRALEKDRARRYPTANSLLQDVDRYLAGEPVEAGPPSAVYRIRKFASRHRLLLMTACSLTVLLVASMLVAIWQAFRASNERDRAVRALHLAEAERLVGHANENLAIDPERSLILAMHAVNRTRQLNERVPAVEGALHTALLSSQVRRTLTVHTSEIRGLAFSPDGKRLATGADDGVIKIWNVESGRQLLSVHSGAAWVWNLAFNPDGTALAVATPDGTCTLWNTHTGEKLTTLRGHGGEVMSAAFSPDGTKVITGSRDSTLRMWDRASGRQLRVYRGHRLAVLSIAFSADGKRLLSGGADGSARLWSVSSGRQLFSVHGHRDSVRSVDLDSSGAKIATASADRTAKIWDAASGRELAVLTNAEPFSSVAFSPDGNRVVTAGDHAQLWEAASGREIFTFRGHTRPVLRAAFSPDGSRLVTSSQDGTVRIWNAANAEELPSVRVSETGPRFGVFTRNGSLVAIIGSDHVTICDSRSGRTVQTIRGLPGRLAGGVFSPAGSYFTGVDREGRATIWRVVNGAQLTSIRHGDHPVVDLAVTPDEKRLATVGLDGGVKVWDLSTGRELLTLPQQDGPLFAVAFTRDGRHLATGGNHGVTLWNVGTGQKTATFGAKTPAVRQVIISPDGTRLATASVDGRYRMWDIATGRELFFLAPFHTGAVFSNDGRRLATANRRGADVVDAYTGQLLYALSMRPAPADSTQFYTDLAFSPDDKHLLAWGSGSVRRFSFDIQELMNLARRRVTRTLTSTECSLYFHTDPCPELP